MEAGGRDKILPSPSLRKALNPIQEKVMKTQGSEDRLEMACRLVT
jgi:hypothetical protein